MNHQLSPFENREIRKVWHNEEWFFSIIDVVEVLTDSPKPTAYWNKVQKNILQESELYPFWIKLKLMGQDNKARPSDCANTDGILRIVMSIPSPKAEPLKLWLVQVGKERIQETENPELGYERMTALYKAKGYPDEWIKERLQSIDTRKKLTDEWKNRGVKEGQEYSLLTAIISKGTFGITPTEHKDIKGLTKPSQNLRDHMTELELILTSLGEAVTRTLSINENAQGFDENKTVAITGGKTAGEARERVEAATGKKVVSGQNYLKSSKANNVLPDPTDPTE